MKEEIKPLLRIQLECIQLSVDSPGLLMENWKGEMDTLDILQQ